jgi:putative transcriptional regulator
MDKDDFAKLVQGVREMGQHMRGQEVPSIRVSEVPEQDVRQIRQSTAVTQAEFARLIGVNLRTLQNWEQQRSRPKGAARALLKIVAADPVRAVRTLHAR